MTRTALLASVCLLISCAPDPPAPGPAAFPAMAPGKGAPPDAPAGPALDPERHGPPGAVIGRIVDPATGEDIPNGTIVELGAEPINAATQTKDGFLIRPKSWPVQLFSYEEGALHGMVALTEASYRGAVVPLAVERWGTDGGLAWFQDTFKMEWPDGVAVVIADIQAPERAATEGVTATLSSESQVTWVYDADGAAQPAHTIVANPAKSWIVWTGVAPGPATVTVTPHPGLTCQGANQIQVLARSIVRVPFFCEPAGG